MTTPPFQPTGWWRSLLSDGTLWGESSDENEIRHMAEEAPLDKRPVTIQRFTRRVEERWEVAESSVCRDPECDFWTHTKDAECPAESGADQGSPGGTE